MPEMNVEQLRELLKKAEGQDARKLLSLFATSSKASGLLEFARIAFPIVLESSIKQSEQNAKGFYELVATRTFSLAKAMVNEYERESKEIFQREEMMSELRR